jgi:preprotein translocase subunit SecG
MLYYLAVTLYAFVCLLLLLVVLLQQGKGGDIASAFGGGGSQTTFGARQGATVLSRATAVLGALFMLASLGLAVWGQRGPGSVVGGMKGPPQLPAAATAPIKPGAESAPAQDKQKQDGATAPAQSKPAPDNATPPAQGSEPQPKQ